MSKKGKYIIKQYATAVLIGLGVLVISLLTRKVFSIEDSAKVMTIFSDSFTLAGGLLMAAWVVAWVSGEGAFNMFGYGWATIRKSFQSKKRSLAEEDRDESYGEYVEKRMSRGRGRRYLHFVVVGVLYFIIGILFSVLYYNVK